MKPEMESRKTRGNFKITIDVDSKSLDGLTEKVEKLNKLLNETEGLLDRISLRREV